MPWLFSTNIFLPSLTCYTSASSLKILIPNDYLSMFSKYSNHLAYLHLCDNITPNKYFNSVKLCVFLHSFRSHFLRHQAEIVETTFCSPFRFRLYFGYPKRNDFFYKEDILRNGNGNGNEKSFPLSLLQGSAYYLSGFS